MYLKAHVLKHCHGSVPHMLILCTVASGFWPRNHPVQPSSYPFTGKSQMCLQKLRPGFSFRIFAYKGSTKSIAKDLPTSPEHQQSLLCFPEAPNVPSFSSKANTFVGICWNTFVEKEGRTQTGSALPCTSLYVLCHLYTRAGTGW